MRKIAVMESFMEPRHRQQITAEAAAGGFAVDFLPAGRLPDGVDAAAYEVLYGAAAPDQLRAFTNLRWYHGVFAGADRYVADELYARPDAVLTSAVGAYGVTLAEHLIMVSLMLLRRYPEFAQIVRERRWVQSLPMRSLYGCRITVLGTGDIGTAFARRAKAMGAAYITGVRRSDRPADECFDRVVTYEALDEVLPETELLIMALPGTAETAGILSAARIAALPERAYVVNVGRGSAIDQEALMEALNAGRLAGAALDVMTPEPLPPEHPLWQTKNLLLTPHCGGNFSLPLTLEKNVALFCENLRRYAAGEPLRNVVDRRRGY